MTTLFEVQGDDNYSHETIRLSDIETAVEVVVSAIETPIETVIISESDPSLVSFDSSPDQIVTAVTASAVVHVLAEVLPVVAGALPVDTAISRVDGEIASVEFETGRVITINRVGGEIDSVADGTHLQTIVRENGEITGIVVTEI